MKVTTERQENCIVQLTISVDDQEENGYLRRSARALARSYRLRGFRPGKAPYNVVVQRLGMDTVRAQVIEQFGDEIFEQGLKESELEPMAQASLEEVTWEPLSLHLKVPIRPEVSLGDYRDIRVHWGVPDVTDEQMDEELLRLQKEQSEWRPDSRPAEEGDQVVLNITGTVEDEVVLENTGREMVLSTESPYPVPGFAEAVAGMEPGETKELDLTYPEDHYNAEIAGKEGHFVVALQEIRVEVLPAMDDEFAMTVGDYESLDDLKTKVRASLQEQAANRAEQEYEEQIWEKLSETAIVEYPEVMVDREVETMKTQFGQQLQQQGMDLDSYFKLTNTDEAAWAEQARPQGEERLTRSLLLAEVIEKEVLTVDAAEIDAEIEEMVAPLGEQAEQIREMFSSPGGKMSIMERLLSRRAIDQLKAIARGEEPEKGKPAPADEEAEEGAGSDAEAVTEEAVAEVTETDAPEAAEADAPAAMEVDAPEATEADVPEAAEADASEATEAGAAAVGVEEEAESAEPEDVQDPNAAAE